MRIRRELSERRAQKCYLSTCSAMTFNSRRHDVTLIEHNVDHYGVFIRDTAGQHISRAQTSSSANEDGFSKTKYIGKCKYKIVKHYLYDLSWLFAVLNNSS